MEKYKFIRRIGQGSFGTVSKIRRISDGKYFVSKAVYYGEMNRKEKELLVSEVNNLRSLNNKNIVRLIERIVSHDERKLFIIMEYCPNGDLGRFIRTHKSTNEPIEERFIWKVLAELSLALRACHNRREGCILHRDIKASNIFIDANKHIKLGDFGLSRAMEKTDFAHTRVGTPFFMSPEQIGECKYNQKSDIWSLGCLLFELAALDPPFVADDVHELNIRISNGKRSQIPKRYSAELKTVISACLDIDPRKRPSADNLLRHPHVCAYFDELETRLNESQTESSIQKEVSKREIQLNFKEKELEEYLKELDDRAKELDEREVKLVEKETALENKERALQMLTKRYCYNKVKENQNIQSIRRKSLPFHLD